MCLSFNLAHDIYITIIIINMYRDEFLKMNVPQELKMCYQICLYVMSFSIIYFG